MVTLMGREHASAVAGLHEAVLTDSVYSSIGRPFLEYYYRNLLKNDDFFCHVHVFEGRVTGFLASTCQTGRIFFRQLLRDSLPIGAVLLRSMTRDPRKLRIVLAASRFLFMQRPTLLPEVEGEVLSFAVLPEYRTTEVGVEGALRPTRFYATWKIPIAAELFFASMRNLARRDVREVKIMTPADNPASNRFYAKVGCRLAVRDCLVFGHPTNFYRGRLEEILSRGETPAVMR